ncbi:MAG: hypothetical protein SF182_23185 [Deltaproteobacteria bacterium]|nr:hypothetical protein [Deltaproteobacteria bacterium]
MVARVRLSHRRAAQLGGWLSLLVIVGHSVLAYLAFGVAQPRVPIDDPFVRWELLNLEFTFGLLVVVVSGLAIYHAGAHQPDGRLARVATVVLAVLWTADALYTIWDPMPLPASVRWLYPLVPLLIGGLALICWYSVFAPSDPPSEKRGEGGFST